MSREIRAVEVPVLWSRLLSICDEQQAALIRSAFSTVLRESKDLACGVFDTHGNMLAQSMTGTPGHINAMATGVRHFLASHPADTLRPGDVLVTNDPWLTAGQINDITVLSPAFDGDRLVGFFANTCHAPDIGGRVLSAEATEVFEEGLRIPVLKLYDRGEPNRTLFELLRANVRAPDETLGDVHAQVGCNEVAARSLVRLLGEYGLDTVDPIGAEIIARSESAMRTAIAALPDGTYEHSMELDGFDGEPITLAVAVTVHGDELTIDFAGSSPQQRRGVNVVLNYTHAYASFAIKAAINPEVPHNEGAFRPVHVVAPQGSILHCTDPAPVASRHVIGHFLPSLVFGALAHVIPERVMAASADALWIAVWRGTGLDGRPFSQTLFLTGGSGAMLGKDGLTTTGFPSGVGGVPVEVLESLGPLVVHRKELRPDSGGVGAHRGGLGQVLTVTCRSGHPWTMSTMFDRTRVGAPGLAGGGAGMPGHVRVNGVDLPSKSVTVLAADDVVEVALPGGGGAGDPAERDVRWLASDRAAGYVVGPFPSA